jgi:glutamine synthetase adenylyltransferase
VQERAISRQHRYPGRGDNSDTSHVGHVSPLVFEREGRESVSVVIREIRIMRINSEKSKQKRSDKMKVGSSSAIPFLLMEGRRK